MESAEEKKRAKEAYMQALQEQRRRAAETSTNGPANESSQPTAAPISAADKRAQMLEERRRRFFEKKGNNSVAKDAGPTEPTGTGGMFGNNSKAPMETNFTPETVMQSPMGAKPPEKPRPEDVNPKDWRRMGYPSEYAYVKAMGLLDLKPEPKHPPVTAVPLNAPVIPAATDVFSSMHQRNDQQGQDVIGSGIAALGGAREDEEARLRKQHQMEYAQQLKQQQEPLQTAPNHEDNGRRNAFIVASDRGKEGSGASDGLGLNIGAVDDKQARRERQAQYAKELQHDAAIAHSSPERGNGKSSGVHGGGLLSALGGESTADAARLRRQHQMEYAQQLEQQMHQQSNQHNRQNQQHNDYASRAPGLGLQIGALDDRETRRQRQNDFAAELHRDEMRKAHAQQQQRQQHENVFGGGIFGGDGGRSVDDAAAIRKQHQQEYAQQLQQQQQQHALLSGHSSGGRSDGVAVTNIGGNLEDKAAKRARQAAYAMELQQQQLQHDQRKNYERHLNRQDDHKMVDVSQHAVGSDDDGWVIGPLGLPVRKTLNIGHRGVQRAYHTGLSPQKQVVAPFGANHAADNYSAVSGNPVNYQVTGGVQPSWGAGAAPVTSQAAQLGGAGVLGAGLDQNLDQREQQAKMLQAQQAKILEAQIEEKRALKEQERRKREQEELQEMQRLERERLEIAANFEREQKEKRLKQEEDNRKELERQIEAKRIQKAEEERKEKEREERENAKMKLEAERKAQREQEEIAREADEKAQQHQQHQLPEQVGQVGRVVHSGQAQRRQTVFDEAQHITTEQEEDRRHQLFATHTDPRMQQPSRGVSRGSLFEQPSREDLQGNSSNISRQGARTPHSMQTSGYNSQNVSSATQSKATLFDPPSHQSSATSIQNSEHQHISPSAAQSKASLFDPPSHPLSSKTPSVAHATQFSRTPSYQGRDYEQRNTPGIAHAQHFDYNAHMNSNLSVGSNEDPHGHRLPYESIQPGKSEYDQVAPPSPNKRRVEMELARRINSQHDPYHAPINEEAPVQSARGNSRNDMNLNLHSLKRNMQQGAMLSGRRNDAENWQADMSLQNVSNLVPVASETVVGHEPSMSSIRDSTPPNGAQHQPHNQHFHQQRMEYQYQHNKNPHQQHILPPRDGSQRSYEQNAQRVVDHSPRLDQSLQHESKFLLPDGSFLEPSPHRKAPKEPLDRWNRMDLLQRPSDSHPSGGICFTPGQPKGNLIAGLEGEVKQPKQIQNENSIERYADFDIIDEHTDTNDLLNDFKDTLQLLHDPNVQQNERNTTRIGSHTRDDPVGENVKASQQRPTTGSSTTSDVDVQRVMKKNRRKWQLLEQINGMNDSTQLDAVLDNIQHVHSRPSTGYCTRPNTGKSTTHSRQLHPQNKHQHPPSMRQNSAEMARMLHGLNDREDFLAPQQKHQHAPLSRPSSGLSRKGVQLMQSESRASSRGSTRPHGGSHRPHSPGIDDPDFDNYSEYGL